MFSFMIACNYNATASLVSYMPDAASWSYVSISGMFTWISISAIASLVFAGLVIVTRQWGAGRVEVHVSKWRSFHIKFMAVVTCVSALMAIIVGAMWNKMASGSGQALDITAFIWLMFLVRPIIIGATTGCGFALLISAVAHNCSVSLKSTMSDLFYMAKEA